MEITCKTERDLAAAAKLLLTEYPSSRVFAFFGAMGAGKTTFIKAICEQLKVVDVVQSPTFAIVSSYNSKDGNILHHFDFYRISKMEEVFDIGYEEYFYSGSYCFIEWPELIETLLPEGTIKVTISGEPERLIASSLFASSLFASSLLASSLRSSQ